MAYQIEIRSPTTPVEWDAYFDLRWRILRQPWGQPRGSEKDDLEHVAIHRAAIIDNAIVSVGRIHNRTPKQAQIRYMATEAAYRKKGIATRLLKDLENEAVRMGVEEIVLNAREQYLDFYLGLGYTIQGEGETLYNTIKHKRLSKLVIGSMLA